MSDESGAGAARPVAASSAPSGRVETAAPEETPGPHHTLAPEDTLAPQDTLAPEDTLAPHGTVAPGPLVDPGADADAAARRPTDDDAAGSEQTVDASVLEDAGVRELAAQFEEEKPGR